MPKNTNRERKQKQNRTEEQSTKTNPAQAQTNFYGPVTIGGSFHSGSGDSFNSTSQYDDLERNESSSVDFEKLRALIIKYFNESEIQNLCFDLGIDFDILTGRGKGDKARELIAYCHRHQRLKGLVEKCAEIRPRISWDVYLREK